MAYARLGDILTSAGIITEEQLQQALKTGRQQNKRLGEVLKESGTITERQLIDVLKIQLGVDFIDLTKENIPASLANLLSKNIAKKHSVVPVKVVGDSLYLAMVDPLDFVAIEEVKSATRKRVIPLIATSNAVQRSIATLYGNEGVNTAIDEMQRTMTPEETEALANSLGSTVIGAEGGDQAAPAIRVVNSIVERAVIENASDIHIEPRESGLVVRMRIDGVLHTILTIPRNLQSSIISRIKIMADMDIAERRLPQDGRANVQVRGQEIDLRISSLPTIFGEKIVIRLLFKSKKLLSTESVGLQGDNLKKYHNLIRNSNGVVLIVGPTGSGKSTTMYTMVGELNSDSVNVVTLEDPIEYNIDGVNQVQINEKIGMTFAGGLRSILRQDPDIIAVGEIRDGETAEIAMRAAITGHLVLSTIHTNDAISALDRLLDIGVEPYLIASALRGVISQRLVRKICPHCKKSYEPTDEELQDLGMERTPGMLFYKGEGCPECLDTGYRGRSAVFEILVMNAEIKQKYRDKAPQAELIKTILASDFVPMMEDCRRLVREGVTTHREVMRILSSTD